MWQISAGEGTRVRSRGSFRESTQDLGAEGEAGKGWEARSPSPEAQGPRRPEDKLRGPACVHIPLDERSDAFVGISRRSLIQERSK